MIKLTMPAVDGFTLSLDIPMDQAGISKSRASTLAILRETVFARPERFNEGLCLVLKGLSLMQSASKAEEARVGRVSVQKTDG